MTMHGTQVCLVMNVMNIITAQKTLFQIYSLAELQGLIVWHLLQCRMEGFVSLLRLL